MPVDNKAGPSGAGANSPASTAKRSRSHSPKKMRHRKHATELGATHPSKTGRKQEEHYKPSSDGQVPDRRVTAQPSERGLRDRQHAVFADAVADHNGAPASPMHGRAFTARLTFKHTGGSVTEIVPDSKNTSKDNLAAHSQYPWLETILKKASPAAVNQPRGRLTWTSYVASIAICGAVVFTVMSIIFAATRAAMESYTASEMRVNLIHDLAQVCESRSCREALWLINASCLTSIDICHDFYGFVCSRWGAKGALGGGLSYTVALGFNYTFKVDEALPRILTWSQTNDTDAYKLALIYRSCVSFFANSTTNLDNMFKAARVDPRAFLKVRNFSELFFQSIRTVIDNKLTSVWKVIYHEHEGVGVLTGTSMTARSFIPEIHEALLEQLSSSIGDKGFLKMVKPIATLDGFIHSITQPHSKETALNEALTTSDDIPAYGVYWSKALYQLSRSRSAEEELPSTVRTNNAGAIRSIVQKLASVPLDVAKAYMLLVPFATYLGFELKTASRRGFLPDSIRAKQCVSYLDSMFGVTAHAVLMEVMGTEKALASASRMWQTLKEKALVMTKIGAGFTLGRDSLLNATLKVRGGGVDSGAGGLPPAFYNNDFMANIIMLARYTDKQIELNPRLVSTHKEDEVEMEFLVPDFFYPDATEASVNYGTLGGYMARMLFTASLPASYPQGYIDCLHKYAQYLRIPFETTDWQRYVKMSWSMHVAFESLPMDIDVRSRTLQWRYYFLRYAIALCGEDAPVKTGFQFAVKSSRSFASAFNCDQPPKYPCS